MPTCESLIVPLSTFHTSAGLPRAKKQFRQHTLEEWRHHGIELQEEPETMANFMPTIGKWFHNRIPAINARGSYYKQADFGQPTLAFHASSVKQGAETIRSGGLQIGVSATDDAPGIYCESEKRLANVLIYATHTLLHSHPTFATTAIFELCVDRAPQHGERRVVNGQWVQREHNVFIVGLHTHIFPLPSCTPKGTMDGIASITPSSEPCRICKSMRMVNPGLRRKWQGVHKNWKVNSEAHDGC